MAFRFVHMADVHLESLFQSRSAAVRERLLAATYRAFEQAVHVAVARHADAVLIAGDLFDSVRLSFRTERHLLDRLRELQEAGIAVCYALGNHDPADADARFHHLEWPANVHRFASSTPRTVEIRRGGRIVARVTGAGHASAVETENLAARFPVVAAGAEAIPHVALLHAQVAGARGAEGHARYAPASPDDLRGKGYDYWALGHVHRRQQVLDDPPAYYPGNLQGRHPGETGPKGVLWVELEAGRAPVVEFLPVAPVVWEEWDLALSPDDASVDGLLRSLGEEQRRVAARAAGVERIVRLRLRGASPLAAALQLDENREELAALVRERFDLLDVEVIADDVRRPGAGVVRPDDHPFVRSLGDLVEEARRDPGLLRALAPPELAGLVPGEDEDEYLARLLEGIEEELAARLAEEAPR